MPQPGVEVLVPVKSLTEAKSRLRGAADDGLGDPAAHARLALALARDTVAAAAAAHCVRRVVVISPDPQVAAALGAAATVLGEGTGPGLNAALEHGAATLRARGWTGPVAAMQADLPALRPEELDGALDRALRLFAAGAASHAYCADATGAGTTLLVCGPAVALRPRFGGGSAAAHAAMGAIRLDGPWPGLHRDVDTADDLRVAAALGLGPATSATLRALTEPLRR